MSVTSLEVKRSLGISRHKLEDNIKMHITEIESEKSPRWCNGLCAYRLDPRVAVSNPAEETDF
jgi:hypothetical protein